MKKKISKHFLKMWGFRVGVAKSFFGKSIEIFKTIKLRKNIQKFFKKL